MNSLMQNYFPLFEMYQSLRNQLMDLLQDEDLGFNPGGANITLGRLCEEMGEVQYSYIQSFQTFKQDFTYAQPDPEVQSSVVQLQTWYAELDQQLREVLEAMTEEDLETKSINRGAGFILPVRVQLEVYKEALLIFYGKASVYLKLLGKKLPEQWEEWIA
jgi:uncharacterized damage-inducible protein DinB